MNISIATKLALLTASACAALALAPERSATASPTLDESTPVAALASGLPVFVDGEWWTVENSWLEQCSGTLRIETHAGSEHPSEDLNDYTVISRGSTKSVVPYFNGGNSGHFNWLCNTNEESSTPGSNFDLLRVKHSNSSREISMLALEHCGDSLADCF